MQSSDASYGNTHAHSSDEERANIGVIPRENRRRALATRGPAVGAQHEDESVRAGAEQHTDEFI